MDLADITLAWMLDQLTPLLSFRDDYILEQWEENEKTYRETKAESRPWSFGELAHVVDVCCSSV